MTGRLRLLVLAAAAAVALSGCGFGGDVDDYLRDTYQRTSTQNGGRSEVFQAAAPVAATASQIAGRHRPLDRISQGGQEFLRYDDDIVGIVPSGGGSQIFLDDVNRGYTRWSAFIIPSWRPGFSGSVRGGGPGFGK